MRGRLLGGLLVPAAFVACGLDAVATGMGDGGSSGGSASSGGSGGSGSSSGEGGAEAAVDAAEDTNASDTATVNTCPASPPAPYTGCCGTGNQLRCIGPKCPNQCAPGGGNPCDSCDVNAEYCCTHSTGAPSCRSLGSAC